MTVLGPNDPRAVYRAENYAWWCKRHFASMSEGGVWAVPRSGLVFEKRGGKLVLISQMPHSAIEGVDLSEAKLLEFQTDDYESIKAHFALAGIEVTRSA